MICQKCGYKRTEDDDPLIPVGQCPACRIFYQKYQNHLDRICDDSPTGAETIEVEAEKYQEDVLVNNKKTVLSVNFKVAGCTYENRPKLINKYVKLNHKAIFKRDKSNKHSQYAVAILTEEGHQIGYVPEFYAEEVAEKLDAGTSHEATFIKLIGYESPIPIVQAYFFNNNAPTKSDDQSKEPTEKDVLQDMAKTSRYRTNNILHLLLSLISFGAWIPIWLIVSAHNTSMRNKIHKNHGQVAEANPAKFALAALSVLLIYIYSRY